MKCIKNNKTGEIIRVRDQQAHQTVGIIWSYISKSEWKKVSRIEVDIKQNVEYTKKQETAIKKQSRRSKLKTKQRELEPSDKILI